MGLSWENNNAVARVCLSSLQVLEGDEEINNVRLGHIIVKVITVKGQIWQKTFWPFGLTEESVISNWNKQQESGQTDWKQI